MKNILVAMDNKGVLEYVKEMQEHNVYNRDISYKEGVIEYLSKNPVDYVITKDSLDGDMTKEIYIKQLGLVVPKAKIIIFVEELDDRYKSFLFANEVFNIIEQKHITRELLKEVIEEADSKVIYKGTNNADRIQDYMLKENTISELEDEAIENKFAIITKQTIAVFGTSGAGKSYISNVVSNIIGEKIGLKTLLVDLDIQNGSVDIYNNLSGENNGLSKIVSEIDNDNLTARNFQKNIQIGQTKNQISYITNNSSLFECQFKLSSKYYKEILNQAKKSYDVVVLDTPNSIFLDATQFSLKNSDIIMFVVNPNYISIRQASKYLDLILNMWDVPKEKIFLIVNRSNKESLSTKQIESLLGDIKVKLTVSQNNKIENILNGLDNITIDNIEDLTSIYEIFGKNKLRKDFNEKYDTGILKRLLEGIGAKR